MAGKPVILVVDDNPDALAAAESDLRGRYDATHRIEPVRSGAAALSTVEARRSTCARPGGPADAAHGRR
jgi:CheY-like chemotaxis protein